MPDSILIFSIGPVQGFIAEARRAQDLWAGSVWLSRAAEAALRAAERAGAAVVYPCLPEAPAAAGGAPPANLPNVLVVRAPQEQLTAVLRAMRVAVLKAFRQPALQARDKLRDMAGADAVWEAIWRRQLARHLELHWAAAPVTGEDYRAAYGQAQRAFEAAKRTRTFRPAAENGLKDSLSGARSALRTAALPADRYWAAVGDRTTASLLRPGGRERLDALGASKRWGFAGETASFPSVSTVAAAPFLMAAANRCADLLREQARRLEALGVFQTEPAHTRLPWLHAVDWPYDGDLLYRETLTAARLEADYGVNPGESALHAAQAGAEALVRSVGEAPGRYYAILSVDGDGMGEHVSACRNEREHADLSRRLARFAEQAEVRLQNLYPGRVIYAGGDDLLALLALPEAVPAACEVARLYEEAFADWPVEALPRRDGRPVPFTVSAGLAIAHHRYPLSAALAAARDAERAAKGLPGKGALCVRVLVRSGAPTQACAHWPGLRERFVEARDFFAQDKLSPRLAYRLAEAAPVYAPAEPEPDMPSPRGFTAGEAWPAWCAEMRRVAQRQRSKLLSEEDAAAFAQRLGDWGKKGGLAPAALAAWLLVAGFTARGGGDA